MTVLAPQLQTMRHLQTFEMIGTVASVRGLSLLVDDLPLPVGALVRIVAHQNRTPRRRTQLNDDEARWGEIIGFDGHRSIVMLLGNSGGISVGMRVLGVQSAQTVQVGHALLGRVLDGLARPMDGLPVPSDTLTRPLHGRPPAAMERRAIDAPLPVGVRAIDGFLTIGRGQRVGIFSGPGVGKSTLLGTIARNTTADVNVIALIGERGREVRDFIDRALGPEGLARSVVIVATGDESPLVRVRAALVACTVAEYFRDAGADVMLMMDSITRFAQAQRQIGLAVGEQPATRGYTPSVFAMLPALLERAGAVESGGSVTGLYAVLVEGDDLNEPVSDAARGILDGHIALSRKLATRGHYPAIDVLQSISRVADDVCDPHQITARRHLIRLLAAYEEAEELINIGAYARGSNPLCDAAIAMRDQLTAFLQQETGEASAFPQTCRRLLELAGEAERAGAGAGAGAAARGRRPGSGVEG